MNHIKKLLIAVKRIAQVKIDSKIPIDMEVYCNKFNCGLMEVVYEWCLGKSFADLCKMTNIYEGSIIRCMRRLHELLSQLTLASKSIGNTTLERKFREGKELLKKDIVFAGSLYI